MAIATIQQTDAERDAKIAELDNLDPNAPDTDPEAPETPEGEQPETPETPDDGGEGGEGGEQPETPDDGGGQPDPEKPKTPPAKTEPKPGDVDYEKKFKDSSAEARILALRNKTYEQKIEEAENLPEPTDEECRKEYGSEWDEKGEMDQKLAKQILRDKRYKEVVRSIHREQKADREYGEKVSAWAVNPETLKQFPELEGNEAAFVEFASKPTRRGLELEDVAVIFKGTRQAKGKAPSGSMFPRPSTSQTKQQPKPATLDADKMSTVRKVDHKAYQEMIRTGKVKPADLL